ncbi:unnamed protein product [Cylicocyclus nassatus]|uniref:Apple domain-containing protein n=1 Tax=Cylicocyclus nassatus TaxID=53992 RepID=A0AA36MGC0_CYLNA|nr:unnamed protein product [Cylicocyclus nassatus]
MSLRYRYKENDLLLQETANHKPAEKRMLPWIFTEELKQAVNCPSRTDELSLEPEVKHPKAMGCRERCAGMCVVSMQHATASFLLVLALTRYSFAGDKPLIIENGAICENKATGFFVVDNTILGTVDSIVYKDTPEEDCLRTCSTNRDRYGRSILCASFVYDHVSFTCTIFKEKAKPEGKADAVQAVGKRYFEKVCLGDAVPMECADGQFIRADDSVLIGFARNVTLVETMEQCVEQCVKELDCKSAMYFYEEGECITNTESALSKPSSFAKEENEKVVYFQNGCMTKLQSRETTTAFAEMTSAERAEEADTALEKGSGREQFKSSEPFTEATGYTTTAELEKRSDEEDAQGTSSAGSTSTTADAALTSEQESELKEKAPENDEDYADDEEEANAVADSDDSVEAKRNKKGEKASYIKYKKHPKNFASKTAKITEKEKDGASEVTARSSVQEEGDSLIADDGGEPVEGQTSPLGKKKHLSIAPVAESAEKVKEDAEVFLGFLPSSTALALEYPTYFSEWSDWTPCMKGGERQIRRRKCLDLRRCLGALMQVRNCPAVLPQPVQSGPVESVRSVIEVPRIPEYDDSETNQSNDRQSTVIQPVEAVWSPWLGVCQHFASGQPCNGGEMIGFESRECIAKEPSLCEGPFFRYSLIY